MSRRSYHHMGETQSALPELRHALCAQRQALRKPNTSASTNSKAGGRDPRPRRPPLLRHTAWRDRPLLRARLQALRSFAHTGGFPLGLAFDQEGTLLSCVGAMGLYRSSRTGEVDQAHPRRPPLPGPRSSTMRGCAIPTISTWRRTAASSSPIPPRATTRMNGRSIDRGRPTGRLICYDPRDRSRRTTHPRQLPLCQRRVHRP